MNKNATLLLFIIFTVHSRCVFAQCPSSITTSVATMAANCLSNGTATVSATPAANPSYTYALTAGPAGSLLNAPQSSNVFNALLPGNYTVQTACGSVQVNSNFTIINSYSPISSITATPVSNCGSYMPGGSISAAVTGGSAPYQYSFVKSNDPNYPDSLSVYSGSNTKAVDSYGNYQVRVKDACNQFYTVTATLHAALTPLSLALSPENKTVCNPTAYNLHSAFFAGSYYPDLAAYNALGGIKVNVYEKITGSCAATGPLLVSFVGHTNYNDPAVSIPVVSSRQYFFQTITPCGDTTTSCYDAATGAENPYFDMIRSVSGCGTMASPLSETIAAHAYGPGIVYPLTVRLFPGSDSLGTLVDTKVAMTVTDVSSLSFTGLTAATYYMVSRDACGHINTQLITNPTGAGAPSIGFAYFETGTCDGAGITTESGRGTGVFTLYGYLPNSPSAKFTIIDGPGSIGDTAYFSGNNLIWRNLLPGTYTVSVTTTCGTSTLQFTMPDNPTYLLKQTITATGASTCGSANSTVTGVTDYNGALTPNFVLVNAVTNIAADSNTNGIFANVAPGQYYVRLKLTNNTWCANTANTPGYSINSNTVTVAAAGAGPTIVKKLGVTCEDINGNQLTTGTAFLSIAGATPLLVEYKLASSSTWITFSSNAAQDISMPGLMAGNIYDVRITSCGITNATQVTIGQLSKIHTTTSMQPCTGNTYELALPQLSGGSYEWRNPAGTVVSTAYNYTIPVYNNSFDGTYTGTVTWGSCVKRADTVTLSASLCGTGFSLPVHLSSFTATVQNCTVALNWKIATASGFKGFDVERSANAKDYTTTASLPFSSEKANYNYNDNSTQQGAIYYRLKMIDNDGHYQYSNTIAVNARCNSAGAKWYLYPAIAEHGSAVTIKLTTSQAPVPATIVVTSITGQRIYAYDVAVHTGQNSYTLPNYKLNSGTYLVCVYDRNLERIGSVQKLVYTR